MAAGKRQELEAQMQAAMGTIQDAVRRLLREDAVDPRRRSPRAGLAGPDELRATVLPTAGNA